MTAHSTKASIVHLDPAALAPQAAAHEAARLATQRLAALAGVLSASKDLVEAATGYLATREQERTRRAEIEARTRVEVTRIAGETASLTTAVQRTFDDRATAIQGLLTGLERAAASGDLAAQEALLGALVGVLGQNPLGDLARFHRARQGDHVEI